MLSTLTFKLSDRNYFVNIGISQKNIFRNEGKSVGRGSCCLITIPPREGLWFCQSVEQLCLHGSGGTFCKLRVTVPERYWSVPVCKKTPLFVSLFRATVAENWERRKIWVSYGMHVKYTCPSQLSANAASPLSSQLQELIQDEQYLQNWWWKQQ